MPRYEYFCHACKRSFPKTLTQAEYEEGGIVCPLRQRGRGRVLITFLPDLLRRLRERTAIEEPEMRFEAFAFGSIGLTASPISTTW